MDKLRHIYIGLFKSVRFEWRTLFIIFSDLFVIAGVIFWGWSPARMLAFYYLDLGSLIIAYIIYNVIIKEIGNNFGPILFSTLLIFLLAGVLFSYIISLTGEYGSNWRNPLELYYPYFDVGIYLVGLFSAQFLTVKAYLAMPKKVGKPKFSLYLATNFFLIPGLIIFSLLLEKINPHMGLNLIISLILLRHFMEYKRHKSLQADT